MAALGDSYEMIGRILAKMINGGLRRQSVTVGDVASHGSEREALHHFVDVMVWLEREGMLNIGSAFISGDFSHVQLTAKGIAAVEKGMFDGSSIRETVEKKSEGGLTAESYGKIGALIGGWMGAAAQTFS
jgi:hypothetical protein